MVPIKLGLLLCPLTQPGTQGSFPHPLSQDLLYWEQWKQAHRPAHDKQAHVLRNGWDWGWLGLLWVIQTVRGKGIMCRQMGDNKSKLAEPNERESTY